MSGNFVTRFRGKIQQIAAFDELLYIAVNNPQGQALGGYCLQLNKMEQATTTAGRVNALLHYPMDGGTIAVASDDEHAFFATEKQQIVVVKHQEKARPLAQLEQPIKRVKASRKGHVIADVGSAIQLIAVDTGEVTANFSLPHTSACLDVSLDGRRIAVGLENGSIAYFAYKDGAYQQQSVVPVHDGSVDAVVFVRDADGQEHLVSFGLDLRCFQTNLNDMEPLLRSKNGLHSKPITSSIRGPYGRFYTISQDGNIKAWDENFSRRPPATTDVDVPLQSVCMVAVPIKKGSSWENEQRLLVALNKDANHSKLSFYSLNDDGDNRGKVRKRENSYWGAGEWLRFKAKKDTEGRREAQALAGTWRDDYSLQYLLDALCNDKDKQNRQLTFEALIAEDYPRLLLDVESLLTKSQYENVRLAAFAELRRRAQPGDLSYAHDALENEEKSVVAAAVDALAAGQDIAALTGCLHHKMKDIQQAARQQLEQVIPDVSGVLLGLEATEQEVRQEALLRLYERGFVAQPKAQDALRAQREGNNPKMRTIAYQLSLLSRPNLAAFARAKNEVLHRQLIDIEVRGENLTKEQREEKYTAPPDAPAGDLEDVDYLLLDQLYASQHTEIAVGAAIVYAQQGDFTALPVLLLLSREDDVSIRLQATKGLELLADLRATQRLATLMLEDADAQVRKSASDAYRQRCSDAISYVNHGLFASHNDVRQGCMNVLAAVIKESVESSGSASEAQITALNQALHSERFADVYKQAYTIYSNHQLAGEHPATLTYVSTSTNAQVRKMAYDEIIKDIRQDWAIPLAITCLNDENASNRTHLFSKVQSALGASKQQGQFLRGALTCAHIDIRRKVFDALQQFDDGWVVDVLITALENPDTNIRSKAFAAALAKKGGPQGISQFLSRAVKAQFDDVRQKVLEAVTDDKQHGVLQAGWRTDVLIELLNDDDVQLRRQAIRTLVNLGGVGLDTAVASEYFDVRIEAALVLARQGNAGARSPIEAQLSKLPPEAEEFETEEGWKNAKQHWEGWTAKALAAAGELAAPELFESIYAIVTAERYEAYRSLQELAVEVLGWLASQEQLEKLWVLTGAENKTIAFRAALGLARSGDARGLELIGHEPDNPAELLEAIQACGEDGHSFALQLFHSSHQLNQDLLLAEGLRLLQQGGSTAFLGVALTSGDPETRLMAAELIEVSHDFDTFAARLLEMVNDWDHFSLNSHQLASIGANWYSISANIYEYYRFHQKEPEKWQVEPSEVAYMARLLGHGNTRVRARISQLLHKLRHAGLSQNAFRTTLAQLSTRYLADYRQFRRQPLDIVEAQAYTLALGSYIGILRANEGSLTSQRIAMRRLVGLSNHHAGRVKAALRAHLFSDNGKLRMDAFGHLISQAEELQVTSHDIALWAVGSAQEDLQKVSVSLLLIHENWSALHDVICTRDDKAAVFAYNALMEFNRGKRLVQLQQAFLRERGWKKQLAKMSLPNNIFAAEKAKLEEWLTTKDDGSFVHADAVVVAQFEEWQQEAKAQRLSIWRAALSSPSTKLRTGAVTALTKRRQQEPENQQVRDVLLEALSSSFSEVQQLAAVSLANAGIKEAFEPLVKLLSDNDHDTQKTAINALLQLKDERTSAVLLQRLTNDPRRSASVQAIFTALTKIDDRTIVEPVFALLGGTYQDQAMDLLLRLSAHQQPIPESHIWANMTAKQQEEENEKQYNDELLGRVLRFCYRQGLYERISKLVKAAKTARTAAVFPALKNIASLPKSSDTDALRDQAVQALGWRLLHRSANADALYQQLQENVQSASADTAFYAAEGMGLAGKADGFSLLAEIAAADDSQERRRIRAIDALGVVGNYRIVDVLLRILGLDALGQALEEQATSSSALRCASYRALGGMSQAPRADMLFSILASGSRKRNSQLVLACVQGMRGFATEAAFAALRQTYADHRTGKSSDAQRIRQEVVQAMENDSSPDAELFLLDVLENEKLTVVLQDAYGLLTKRLSEEDIRADLALYGNEKDIPKSEDSKERIKKWASAAELFDLVFVAHDKHKSSQDANEWSETLAARQPVPVTEALQALQRVVEKNTEKALKNVFYVLQDGADDFNDEQKTKIVEKTTDLREQWATCQLQVQRGNQKVKKKQQFIASVWRRLLVLCGRLGVGQSELVHVLTMNGVPKAMLKESILAIKVDSEASAKELLAGLQADNRFLRIMVATLLKNSPAAAAAGVPLVMDEPAALRELVGTGSIEVLQALYIQAEQGQACAIVELGRLEAVTELAELAASTQAKEVRKTALLTMGTIADEAAVQHLGALAQQEVDEEMRRLAWSSRRRSIRRLQRS